MEQKLYICNTKKTMIMDLEARKHQFIQKLSDVNESLFEQLENLLKKGTKEQKRISIEQYNKELDKSIAQIEKGETYTHQEVGERIKQWAKQ